MKSPMRIAGRPIGSGHRPYVVAEMSGNHNHDLDRALELIERAQKAGADAIKIQTYTADTITLDHDGPEFMINEGPWAGRRLYDLYQEAMTPWEWLPTLFARARDLSITIFSSPFDETAIAFLEELDAPAYKIASFEIVDIPLIEAAAETRKPLIISTGMANVDEISAAVAAARNAGCQELALLHCVSGYPAPADESNLLTLVDMASRFDVSAVGLSDHSLGTAVSVAAVGLGAALIEKHFTLNRSDGGPDAEFSLEADELAELCRDCATAWEALGETGYRRTKSEEKNIQFRRSLYAVEDIPAGKPLTKQNVRSIRPGFGLPPGVLPDVIGRKAAKTIPRGTALDWSLIK